MNAYYIGGASCAGKTTTARRLAQKYDLMYLGVDDHLGTLAEYGIRQGFPICTKHSRMSIEELLMRPPLLQCRELIRFYEELHGRIMEMLQELNSTKPILAEGIAFMPALMNKDGINPERYVCLTAPPEFQEEHYKARDWTYLFLEGCRDKETAFQNWMKREELFSQEVRRQASDSGYRVIDVSAGEDLEEFLFPGKH